MKVQDALKQDDNLRVQIAGIMHKSALRDQKRKGGAGYDGERAAAYKRILDDAKKECESGK